ncbi:Transposase IS4 [Fragilaria crotonensis]|nr:Transposase IS4 [Fragilaria crotonensis]
MPPPQSLWSTIPLKCLWNRLRTTLLMSEIACDEMPVDALGEEIVADVAQNNIAAAATETDANVQTVEWVGASIDDPPLNGMVPQQMWSIRNSVGEAFTPGVNIRLTQDVSPLEFFLLMFPSKELTDMVRWTNLQLLRLSMKLTDASELLKFFGVLILTTKFVFTT